MPDDPTAPPLPPHDGAAERAVLGALLLAGNVALDDCGDLRPADFYWPQHAALWSLLAARIADAEPVDPVAVAAALARDPIRGVDAGYLHTLVQSVPTIAQAGWYAGIIRARATAREIIRAGQRVVQVGHAHADADDMAEAIDRARGLIDAATDRTGARADDTLSDQIAATIDAILQPPAYIETPWWEFDTLLGGGWAPGALYAIGGRPGIGKSVVLLDAATHAAKLRVPTVVFTLEMSRGQYLQRLLAAVAEVPYGRIRAHTVTDDDMRRLVTAQAAMAEWPLRIIDNSQMHMSPASMRREVRRLSARRPVGMVVVDYLQLMASPAGSKAPRQEVVADFSRSLKLMAGEFGCPVLVGSQLNRKSEDRADKMPGLSDLRESGAIEQDCDGVVLLHRDLDAAEDFKREELGMSLAKNRFGPVGCLTLHFQGWFQRVRQMGGRRGNVAHIREAS